MNESKEALNPNAPLEQWSCTLAAEDREETIAAILRKYTPAPLSWNQARQLVLSGKVFLDGERLSDPAWRAKRGEVVSVQMSAPRRALQGELETERILWVDEHIVIINKPPGLLSYAYEHQEGEPSAEILTRGALQRIRKGRAKDPLFLVHRLDKDCSGVMLFARSKEAKKALKDQFAAHEAEREYRALAAGHPQGGTVRGWITDDRGDGYRGSVPEELAEVKHAQEAITHIKILERFQHATLIACRLETGRTHQIRIHLSEKGCPLLGDPVYIKACRAANKLIPLDIPEAKRLALHAYRLNLKHPITHAPLQVTAPIPDDIQSLLNHLRKNDPLLEPLAADLPAKPARKSDATESSAKPAKPARKSSATEGSSKTAKPARKSSATEGSSKTAKPARKGDATEGSAKPAKPARKGDATEGSAKTADGRPAQKKPTSPSPRPKASKAPSSRPTRRKES